MLVNEYKPVYRFQKTSSKNSKFGQCSNNIFGRPSLLGMSRDDALNGL